jgi:hypothetical protein
LLAPDWTASAFAWAIWLLAIVWTTLPSSAPVWVRSAVAEAEAEAETEFVWVTFGVSTAGV